MENGLREGAKCVRCGKVFTEEDDWEISSIMGSAICIPCYKYGRWCNIDPEKCKEKNAIRMV